MTFALGYVIGPTLGATVFGWRPEVLWVGWLAFCLLAAWLVAHSPRR